MRVYVSVSDLPGDMEDMHVESKHVLHPGQDDPAALAQRFEQLAREGIYEIADKIVRSGVEAEDDGDSESDDEGGGDSDTEGDGDSDSDGEGDSDSDSEGDSDGDTVNADGSSDDPDQSGDSENQLPPQTAAPGAPAAKSKAAKKAATKPPASS